MSNTCLVVTPEIQKLVENIEKVHPQPCQRAEFNADMCAEWVGAYNDANNKKPDFIPGMVELVGFIEKQRNKDGKSFLYIPESITYTPIGKKQQTYNIIDTKIFNKDGKEVYTTDSKNRRRIFANLAVQQKRAVVVEHKGKKYVVNNRNQIISVATGDMMKWREENGDRKAILASAQKIFEEKQKAATATTPTQEFNSLTNQEIEHLKSIEINVFNRSQIEKYLKEHPNTLLQQVLEEQWEMQDIKAKAIADGTFMKAPNGKPTNLNERQWLQVRTKNFKNWFGDWINDPKNASKVVDENSEPLVVYHGTHDEFTTFNYEKFGTTDGGNSGKGFYFTPSKEVADIHYGRNGKVLEVFLNIRTPMHDHTWGTTPIADSVWFGRSKQETIDTLHNQIDLMKEEGASETDLETAKQLVEKFIANYDSVIPQIKDKDGVVSYRKNGEIYEYVISDPNQVKSATGNNGDFSTENDDIQMSIGGIPNIFDEKFAESADNVVSLHQASVFLNNLAQQIEAGKSLDNTTKEVFNEIINKVQNGEIRIKGTDGQMVGQITPILTVLSRFGRERYRTSGRQGQMEKTLNLVRGYLQQTGEWQEQIDVNIEKKYGKASPKSGIESQVFFVDGSAIKLQSLSTAKLDLNKAIERILLQNEFDPTCQTEIIGVGETQHEEFRLLLKQPHIKEAVEATKSEIKADMKRRGFEYAGIGDYGPIYKNSETGEIVEDVQSRNVLKTKDGVLHYIDVIPSKNRKSLSSTDPNITQFYTTPEGEVYGFVDKDGNIYLDETIIDASHPIHEYTHLWDRALEKNNPQLWKKGIKLMQEGAQALWNEIANSENYGKLWQSKGIKGERLINLIASEVHSRLVGDNGAKLLDQIAKEKGRDINSNSGYLMPGNLSRLHLVIGLKKK